MKTQADLLNFRVAELLTFRLPKTVHSHANLFLVLVLAQSPSRIYFRD
jgi:hypothetical protein